MAAGEKKEVGGKRWRVGLRKNEKMASKSG